MTLADDLRAADAAVTALSLSIPLPPDAQKEVDGLATRLRAHAETIERVEGEMRDWVWTADRTPSVMMHKWSNALRGDSNG